MPCTACGRPDTKIVAASLFSTQSATTDLAKINRQIKQSTPAPVNFNIGTTAAGTVRALFPTASLLAIQFNRQTGTAPTFASSFLPTPALNIVPGAVGQIAYGTFSSPDYETADKFIPATGTLTGCAAAAGHQQLAGAVLPAAGRQARRRLAGRHLRPWLRRQHVRRALGGGLDARLARHRQRLDQRRRPWRRAARHAERAAPGSRRCPWSIPAGGRGIDQDGNGTIDSTEGSSAAPPRTVISSRDGLRQTVVDLMQLVREIEVGVDVDGDGTADLDAQRIYYAGQSFGGIYGTMILGVEPSIKAGVPNVPGGSIIEIVRLSPVFRAPGRHRAGRPHSVADQRGRHQLQREHPAARPAAVDQHRGRRDGHPEGVRLGPVGAAGRQPGVVCGADPQAAAAGRRGQAGDHPVRQG